MERDSIAELDRFRGAGAIDIGRVASVETKKGDENSIDLSSMTQAEVDTYLRGAREIDEFKGRARRLLMSIGLHDFAHHDISPSGALDVFGTYPEKVIDEYAREGFHQEDLMLLHARSLSCDREYIFLSDIRDYIDSAPFSVALFYQNLEIAKFWQRRGVLDMCGIILDGDSRDQRAIFRISGNNIDPSEFKRIVIKYMEYLRNLAASVDSIGRTKFRKKFRNKKNPRIPVTEKPLRLLSALNKDLSLNEAASVLHISISTANQHIAAAKKAFGTETMHGTLIAAYKQGFLGDGAL